MKVILILILLPTIGFSQHSYKMYKSDSIRIVKAWEKTVLYSRRDSAQQTLRYLDTVMSYSQAIDSLVKILRVQYPTRKFPNGRAIWRNHVLKT